jgi:hypothetical protein
VPRRFALAVRAGLVAAGLAASVAAAATGDFPPYLPDPDRLSPDVRAEVQAIWRKRTISRAVVGQPAPVPIELYRLFVDRPEVTAAAGQHLGLPQYRVVRQGADLFDIEDNEGTRARYRVVLKGERERVLVARLQRSTRLVGDVSGASVSVLTFAPETASDGTPQVAQRVESVVRIDHRLMALVARILVPLFPQYADRKIAEVFNIAARVSAWGYGEPAEFCLWLGGQPEGAQHRQVFARYLPACGASGTPLK